MHTWQQRITLESHFIRSFKIALEKKTSADRQCKSINLPVRFVAQEQNAITLLCRTATKSASRAKNVSFRLFYSQFILLRCLLLFFYPIVPWVFLFKEVSVVILHRHMLCEEMAAFAHRTQWEIYQIMTNV